MNGFNLEAPKRGNIGYHIFQGKKGASSVLRFHCYLKLK